MPRVTITVPDRKSQPYRFALDRKSVTLGRGSENDIVVDCASVSVRHAVMERIEGGYELRDLGSTNGTKFGGKPRDFVPLHDGISVKIGDVAFDFSLTPEELKELEKERPADEIPIIKEDEVDPPRKEKRPPERSAQHRPLASANQPSPGASFMMTLAFLVLAGFIFFVGMSIRHQNDTGRSLLGDMKNPPSPAESAEGEDPPPEEPAE